MSYPWIPSWRETEGSRLRFILSSCPQAASPACTELETVMMDWLGKMVQLPEAFLAGEAGEGGGVIQVRWRGKGPDSGGAGGQEARKHLGSSFLLENEQSRALGKLCIWFGSPAISHSQAAVDGGQHGGCRLAGAQKYTHSCGDVCGSPLLAHLPECFPGPNFIFTTAL